jgi:hypothetical protein
MNTGEDIGRRAADHLRLIYLACFLALPVANAATAAAAPGERWWGVIVGVGEYEHLDSTLALEGPQNDVPLVLDWLAQQQVPRKHLTVLADHVPHADALPTRAAILAALAALPQRMHQGDFAFLYFAGHGSQQPQGDRAWSKADGLDETFLPRDVGRWDGTSGRVAGAIVGGEIGRQVEALRERGIFVWLVFDSCHSATGARAVAIPGMHVRSVPPETLGVPPMPDRGAQRTAEEHLVHPSTRVLPGGYVAFYAAQTAETEPEMPLPAGLPERRIHGLFTYALLQSLGASDSGSYREVAHRILAFDTTTYPDTTPEFEGSLDERIGPKGSPLAPHDWLAQRDGAQFRIAAGRLSGVSVGSLLALSPAFAARAAAAPMALLRVSRATLTESWADSVTGRKELARWHIAADRSEELGAGIARLLEADWDLNVRISGPVSCLGATPSPLGCGRAAEAATAPALAKARSLVDRVRRPAGLEPSADGGSADLELVARDQRLYLIDPRVPPVSLEQSASVELDAVSAQADLQAALYRATRVAGLHKLAADFPGKPDALHLELWVRGADGARQRLDIEHGVTVSPDAELAIRLQNAGSDDLDVTILFVDPRFTIEPVFPVDRETNRLPRHSAPVEVPGWAGAPGRYELIVIAEQARAGQPHDVTYLAQPGVQSRQAADGSDFDALLLRMGFERPGTRAPLATPERHTALMQLIRYEVREPVTGRT